MAFRTPAGSVALCLSAALAAFGGTGCRSMLYSQTGDVTSHFAVEHMTPYVLGTDDADAACMTGVALGNFTMAFERVTDRPDLAALSALVSAALCAEGQAWEAELESIRLSRAGRSDEAQDARLREKRLHARAARRYHAAWKRLVAAWGTPGADCPEIETRPEKALYLMGLIAGAQSVLHDRAAEGEVGVPLDVPRQAARGSECLRNDLWFGAPAALRAGIWLGVPGAAPEGTDPWQVLSDAAALSDLGGVRIARAVQIESLAAAGRQDDVKTAITAYAQSVAAHPVNPEYRLLDTNAHLIVLQMSDRIWTREVGHRTPANALGTFPAPAGTPAEDPGLFDGLDATPTPAAPGSPTSAPAAPSPAPPTAP
jgi:hypothetical protein